MSIAQALWGFALVAALLTIIPGLDTALVLRSSLTLPIDYQLGRWNTLLATMQRDKKARAGMMRFIVLDDVGKPRVLAGPEEATLFTAYQEVGV